MCERASQIESQQSHEPEGRLKQGMYLPTWLSTVTAIIYLATVTVAAVVLINTLSLAADAETAAFIDSIWASSAAGAGFAALFYFRKLYRDLFAGLGKTEAGTDGFALATFLYYLSRPLFAAAISVLFTIAMFESIKAFSEGHVGINPSFVFFAALSSAFIAIATGAAINRIEDMARTGHSFFRPPM